MSTWVDEAAWRARCDSCGWAGEMRTLYSDAYADIESHLVSRHADEVFDID